MAYALELALGIPPAWGYLICALVVIPLVTHGVSMISRFQVWTQPLWLVMMVVPFVAVALMAPKAFTEVLHYGGATQQVAQFEWHLFGAALTVGVALITQMGEQADYLRFMPAPQPGRAVDPNQMYLAACEYVFADYYGWAVAATALFVVISQLKINVTNAYAGSLAWSNFFSRLTHSHPGRVVWVVFNTFIAFMLMEMNVFQALGQVLGVYSNIAIAWIMAVVADLVVNKPLGLSPPGIEFKRACLYAINPVGVGAMVLASVLSIAAHMGLMGPTAEAFSAIIAMVTAFVAAPAIAWLTKGRFHIARLPHPETPRNWLCQAAGVAPLQGGGACGAAGGVCVVCERDCEGPDMAHCAACCRSACGPTSMPACRTTC